MMYPVASEEEVTYSDYPVQYPPSVSSMERIDRSEIFDSLIFSRLRQKLPTPRFQHLILSSLLEIESSSVQPSLVLKSENSSMGKTFEERNFEEILEYDVIVRIPPRKRYTIDLHIKEIRKAEPIIVEPEKF
jgi:hypothetical protein